jgi:hypothetical protein
LPLGSRAGDEANHYQRVIEKEVLNFTREIRNRGVEYLEAEFPLVDYITQCNVVAADVDYT